MALQKKASASGYELLNSEICFNIEVAGALSAEQTEKLLWLLRETFEPERCAENTFLKVGQDKEAVLEVGPRQQFTSAWSTNAVSICASIGLDRVTRIERSRRYLVKSLRADAKINSLAEHVHDRMTECVYPNGITSFESHGEPEKWTTVPLLAEGRQALEKLSKEKGLGFDEQDIEMYLNLFRDDLKRDPTVVECFDLAQGNSEHSRHWFFGGKMVIDGKEMPSSLFQLVKRPFKARPANSTIAFKDNSSALRGYQHATLMPQSHNEKDQAEASFTACAYAEVQRDYDVTCTVETHNFPCGIAPFPGAETGAGGRIRDGDCGKD